jgi:chitinase
MTPQTPKPSIHDVATGFMVPTSADTGAGISQGFGVTTNIINGGQECGKGFEDARSSDRIKYYKAFLEYFDLPGEDESTMTCGGQ